MKNTDSELTCFVISPIGQADSEIRRQADRVLNFLIRRTLEPMGYQVTRADEISEPGTINLQVMKRIVDSQVVVADLTGTNPNVMYELAIRHAIKKPVILMIKHGEKIPFDIASERTIFYELNDVEFFTKAQEELARQIQFIRNSEFKVDTPFSLVEGLIASSKANEDEVDNWAVVLDDIGFIKSTLKKILDKPNGSIQTPASIENTSPSWRKIRIEFPGQSNMRGSDLVEIASDQSIANVLNDIYFLLHENETSAYKPDPYTYLWDWVLVRQRDGIPLIIKGVQQKAGAFGFFSDGETWEIQVLDEPLLNRAERFNLRKGQSNS